MSCVRFSNSSSNISNQTLNSNKLACSSDEGTLAVFDLTQADEEEALECFLNLDQTIIKMEYYSIINLIFSFLDNASFLFQCMNNLCGVYNSETGMTAWKYQYQNSINDKSDYFLNTQIFDNSPLCMNFRNNKIMISEFNNISSSNTSLIPKVSTELVNFDSSNYFVRDAFCTNPESLNSHIISLRSDNILQISPSVSTQANPLSQTPQSKQDNILSQMTEMYS